MMTDNKVFCDLKINKHDAKYYFRLTEYFALKGILKLDLTIVANGVSCISHVDMKDVALIDNQDLVCGGAVYRLPQDVFSELILAFDEATDKFYTECVF